MPSKTTAQIPTPGLCGMLDIIFLIRATGLEQKGVWPSCSHWPATQDAPTPGKNALSKLKTTRLKILTKHSFLGVVGHILMPAAQGG